MQAIRRNYLSANAGIENEGIGGEESGGNAVLNLAKRCFRPLSHLTRRATETSLEDAHGQGALSERGGEANSSIPTRWAVESLRSRLTGYAHGLHSRGTARPGRVTMNDTIAFRR